MTALLRKTRASRWWSTSPPRATSIAASCRPSPSWTPTSAGRCALLEAARATGVRRFVAGLHRRGLRLAGADRRLRGDHADLSAQPVLRQQGRRRSLRGRLPSHPRHGHRHHPLLQQLRALPVSREADPAHDPERLRRASRCPSTATACRCATGSTSRITARRSISRVTRARAGRRLQHRRRERAAQPGRRARHPEADRARRIADPPRRRSPWPRSPLRHELGADPRASSAGRPRHDFERGLADTVAWYRDNGAWCRARAQRRLPRLLRRTIRRAPGHGRARREVAR